MPALRKIQLSLQRSVQGEKMRARPTALKLTAVTAIVMSLTLAQPANAEETTLASGCVPSDFESGNCITAMWVEGQDPVLSGVEAAIERGETKLAEKFVKLRGKTKKDAKQNTLEDLLSGEAPDSVTPMAASPDAGGTDGFVLGNWQHMIAEVVWYGTCTPTATGCIPEGSLSIDFTHALYEYPITTLDGFIGISVNSAPIKIEDVECRTRYNGGWNIDSTVHTWNNCAAAETSFFTTVGRNVFTENWVQGGTNNAEYHVDYRIQIRMANIANSTSMVLTGHPYKIVPGTTPGATYAY